MRVHDMLIGPSISKWSANWLISEKVYIHGRHIRPAQLVYQTATISEEIQSKPHIEKALGAGTCI